MSGQPKRYSADFKAKIRLLHLRANARVNPDSPVAEAKRTIEVLTCSVPIATSRVAWPHSVDFVAARLMVNQDGKPSNVA